MKISSAYILTDNAHSALVPIPKDEITEGISWSAGDVQTSYRMSDGQGTVDTGSPTMGYSVVAWNTYEGYLPINFIWEHDFYASVRRTYEWWLLGCAGSVALNITDLLPGRYVAIIDYYIGTREISCYDNNPDKPRYVAKIVNQKTVQTLKSGQNGVVYGELHPEMITYQTNQGYATGEGRVFKITQRSELTISADDTSKIISYGDDSFSFLDFYDSVLFYRADENGDPQIGSGSNVANPILRFGLRTRLFTTE